MTDKSTVCCFRVRRRRFCIASMIAFSIMVLSAVAIFTMVGTSDLGHTIIYILMDFSIIVIFLLIFGLLDEFCRGPENPSPTKNGISKFSQNNSNQNDLLATSTYPMEAACIANTAYAVNTGFDTSYSANPSCSLDVGDMSADASCSAADASCCAGDASCC